MDEHVLLLEVGGQAIEDLSDIEKELILTEYSNDEVLYAAIKVFDLLVKKFQANYRMGKTYEQLSQKYEAYKNILNSYLMQANAGRLGSTNPDNTDVDRYKWARLTQQ